MKVECQKAKVCTRHSCNHRRPHESYGECESSPCMQYDNKPTRCVPVKEQSK